MQQLFFSSGRSQCCLPCRLDKKEEGSKIAKSLILYFGGSGTTGTPHLRNKNLRGRENDGSEMAGLVSDLLFTEHRLVGQCLFQLARRDRKGGTEKKAYIRTSEICDLLEVAKDVAWDSLRPGDEPRYPRDWYIDEDTVGHSPDDLYKSLRANVTYITSILCLTVWEFIKAVVEDKKYAKPNIDNLEKVRKKAQEICEQSVASRRQLGFEAVLRRHRRCRHPLLPALTLVGVSIG